jgi:hypothetical protein
MGQEQEQELGKVAALAQDTAEEQVQVRTMERNKEKKMCNYLSTILFLT